jgi:hypothetical protein
MIAFTSISNFFASSTISKYSSCFLHPPSHGSKSPGHSDSGGASKVAAVFFYVLAVVTHHFLYVLRYGFHDFFCDTHGFTSIKLVVE